MQGLFYGREESQKNYFGFDPESGFETFHTAEEAKNYAQGSMDDYRGISCDCWPEEVENVCWGEISQVLVQGGLRPRNEEDSHSLDMTCDYELQDI